MTQKIKFNLSASSIATYENSPLEFYFKYIIKAPADTKVNMSYGDAGTVGHALAEKYIKDNRNKEFDYKNLFEESWKKYKLDTVNGFNGKPLDKQAYFVGMQNTFNFIDNTEIDLPEHNFLFPLINDDRAEINIKGFVDAIDTKNHIIYDWKTNSRIKDFRAHALMYCYAYWKEFGSIPKAVYYYSILNKIDPYSFSETQLQAYEKRLEYLAESILQKGFNAELYEPRKWEHAFNSHAKACEEHVRKRKEQNREQIRISIAIKNNTLFFDNSLPDDIKSILMKKYKYKVAGCEFSEFFQKRLWDGNKRFFSHNSIPLGFIHDFENLITDYNEYFNKSVILDYIDLRDNDVKDMIYDTKFKDSDYTLYDFQEDCVNKAIENEIGIVFVGTGGGKTLISSEIIRRLNRRSLYLVNRIELGEQVRDNLEEMLGVKVGLMSEGNMVIDNQITVASIQTIGAILKRKDQSTVALIEYLYGVSLVIADESQNIKDIGFYGILRTHLINCRFIIGLSGTPFRS